MKKKMLSQFFISVNHFGKRLRRRRGGGRGITPDTAALPRHTDWQDPDVLVRAGAAGGRRRVVVGGAKV